MGGQSAGEGDEVNHDLSIRLGDKSDLDWAQRMVTADHYLHQSVHRKARPHCYVIQLPAGQPVGLVIISLPHATRNRGWWGYPGLPTQWQVVDISRIWLSPLVQIGGDLCRPLMVPGFVDRRGDWRPAVATWAIGEVLKSVGEDRVSLWPPVYLDQPYHIRLAISYHDPQYHSGTIYRQSKALPMYTDDAGSPIVGPSGKYGWCWKLSEPTWTWQDIHIRQPRTLRMAI